jgi:hypothetical protein
MAQNILEKIEELCRHKRYDEVRELAARNVGVLTQILHEYIPAELKRCYRSRTPQPAQGCEEHPRARRAVITRTDEREGGDERGAPRAA